MADDFVYGMWPHGTPDEPGKPVYLKFPASMPREEMNRRRDEAISKGLLRPAPARDLSLNSVDDLDLSSIDPSISKQDGVAGIKLGRQEGIGPDAARSIMADLEARNSVETFQTTVSRLPMLGSWAGRSESHAAVVANDLGNLAAFTMWATGHTPEYIAGDLSESDARQESDNWSGPLALHRFGHWLLSAYAGALDALPTLGAMATSMAIPGGPAALPDVGQHTPVPDVKSDWLAEQQAALESTLDTKWTEGNTFGIKGVNTKPGTEHEVFAGSSSSLGSKLYKAQDVATDLASFAVMPASVAFGKMFLDGHRAVHQEFVRAGWDDSRARQAAGAIGFVTASIGLAAGEAGHLFGGLLTKKAAQDVGKASAQTALGLFLARPTLVRGLMDVGLNQLYATIGNVAMAGAQAGLESALLANPEAVHDQTAVPVARQTQDGSALHAMRAAAEDSLYMAPLSILGAANQHKARKAEYAARTPPTWLTIPDGQAPRYAYSEKLGMALRSMDESMRLTMAARALHGSELIKSDPEVARDLVDHVLQARDGEVVHLDAAAVAKLSPEAQEALRAKNLTESKTTGEPVQVPLADFFAHPDAEALAEYAIPDGTGMTPKEAKGHLTQPQEVDAAEPALDPEHAAKVQQTDNMEAVVKAARGEVRAALNKISAERAEQEARDLASKERASTELANRLLDLEKIESPPTEALRHEPRELRRGSFAEPTAIATTLRSIPEAGAREALADALSEQLHEGQAPGLMAGEQARALATRVEQALARAEATSKKIAALEADAKSLESGGHFRAAAARAKEVLAEDAVSEASKARSTAEAAQAQIAKLDALEKSQPEAFYYETAKKSFASDERSLESARGYAANTDSGAAVVKARIAELVNGPDAARHQKTVESLNRDLERHERDARYWRSRIESLESSIERGKADVEAERAKYELAKAEARLTRAADRAAAEKALAKATAGEAEALATADRLRAEAAIELARARADAVQRAKSEAAGARQLMEQDLASARDLEAARTEAEASAKADAPKLAAQAAAKAYETALSKVSWAAYELNQARASENPGRAVEAIDVHASAKRELEAARDAVIKAAKEYAAGVPEASEAPRAEPDTTDLEAASDTLQAAKAARDAAVKAEIESDARIRAEREQAKARAQAAKERADAEAAAKQAEADAAAAKAEKAALRKISGPFMGFRFGAKPTSPATKARLKGWATNYMNGVQIGTLPTEAKNRQRAATVAERDATNLRAQATEALGRASGRKEEAAHLGIEASKGAVEAVDVATAVQTTAAKAATTPEAVADQVKLQLALERSAVSTAKREAKRKTNRASDRGEAGVKEDVKAGDRLRAAAQADLRAKFSQAYADAAVAAKKAADKISDAWDKALNDRDGAYSGGHQYGEAHDAILEAVGLQDPTGHAATRIDGVYLQMLTDGHRPKLDRRFMNDFLQQRGDRSLGALTLAQASKVHEALTEIRKASAVNAKARERAEAVKREIFLQTAETSTAGAPKPPEGTGTRYVSPAAQKGIESAKVGLAKLNAFFTKPYELLARLGKAGEDLFFDHVVSPTSRESSYLREYAYPLADHLDSLPKDLQRTGSERIDTPWGRAVTRRDVWHLMLHLGTTDGLDRISRGVNMSPGDLTEWTINNIARDRVSAGRVMDSVVAPIWASFEKIYNGPLLDALHREGAAPAAKLEHAPVFVNGKRYAGGYGGRLRWHQNTGSIPTPPQAGTLDALFSGAFNHSQAAPDAQFNEDRTGVVGHPYLDFSGVAESMRAELHLAAWGDSVRVMHAVFSDQASRDRLAEILGKPMLDAFYDPNGQNSMLHRMASGRANLSGLNALQRMLLKFSGAAATQAFTLSAPTLAMQPSHLAAASAALGLSPADVATGVQWSAVEGRRAWAHGQSAVLKDRAAAGERRTWADDVNRTTGFDPDTGYIGELFPKVDEALRLTQARRVVQTASAHAYESMDSWISHTLWEAAYSKAFGGSSDHAAAVREADKAVIRAMPSLRVYEKSASGTDPHLMGLLFLTRNFQNSLYNMAALNWWNSSIASATSADDPYAKVYAARAKGFEAARYLGMVWGAEVLGRAMGDLARASPAKSGRQDDGSDDWIHHAAMRAAGGVGYPIHLQDPLEAVFAAASGDARKAQSTLDRFGRSTGLSLPVRLVQDVGNALSKKDDGQALQSALDAVGVATGLPVKNVVNGSVRGAQLLGGGK